MVRRNSDGKVPRRCGEGVGPVFFRSCNECCFIPREGRNAPGSPSDRGAVPRGIRAPRRRQRSSNAAARSLELRVTRSPWFRVHAAALGRDGA
jgi:hypothetical protein